nr:hypothetical protein [uncultured Agathobaculum sp.]
MRERNMIFSQVELMVLLSLLGGQKLYGFWRKPTYSPEQILQTANALMRHGILDVTESGFTICSAEVRTLLLPMVEANWAILLTPKDKELPQICYMVTPSVLIGYETVAVQPDAVSLFSLSSQHWEEELIERGVLSAWGNPLLPKQRQEKKLEPPNQIPALDQLEQCAQGEWLLEYFQVPQKKAYRAVLIHRVLGERMAMAGDGNIAVSTNDLQSAVALPGYR